jgi:hypothetical protein
MAATTRLGALLLVLAMALTTSLLVALAVTGPQARPAQAQTALPPTLSGEELSALDSGAISVSGACNSEGTTTIDFAASGVASGPYPGTFTESGTATLGPVRPDGSGAAPLVGFKATFTIDSPAGQVAGSKELGPGDPSLDSLGICTEPAGPHIVVAQSADLRYTAEIRTPDDKAFTDQGQTGVAFSDQSGSTFFFELFRSDLLEPEPLMPSTKEQCKDGGYERFGFKNQGDCVRFVQTQGRNEAGKNQ